MGFKEDLIEFIPYNEQEEMDKKWILDFMEKYYLVPTWDRSVEFNDIKLINLL